MADLTGMLQAAAGVSTGNPNAWDISKAYYDVGADAGDISKAVYSGLVRADTDSTSVAGLFFSTDGTNFYTCDGSSNIRQYSLSVPWVITSASYVRVLNVTARDGNTSAIFFRDDGTAMYLIGDDNNLVLQFSLSTAWNISTASFIRSLSITAQEANGEGLFFKPDGTRMYILGRSGDDVNEYSLSTAWNISTASYVQNFSIASQETLPHGLSFVLDGTKMYVVGSSGDDVNEYSLSTAWDISTASYVQNFSLTGQTNQPRDIFFKPDGTMFFIWAATNSAGSSSPAIYQYTIGGLSVAAQETQPQDLFFKPDGTKMYVIGSTGDDVNEYDLSTAWDISTASYVQNFSVATEDTTPLGLFFRDDGLKMYVAGNSGDDINEYSLSVAWDISTASYVQNFSVITEGSAPEALTFKSDGTKMYVVDSTGDEVNEYDLSTAWDISTASYVQNFSVAAQETTPNSIYFRSDGTKMYVAGLSSDNINEYDLSTPWNISSASFTQSFFVGTQAGATRGLFFNGDGLQFFVVDSNVDKVFSYLISEE